MAAPAPRKTTKRAATTRKPAAKKAAPRKAAAKRSAPKKPTSSTAAKTAASKPTVPATQVIDPAEGKKRTGPVLGAYRLSLKGLEVVTVGVGGAALGSLSTLGLPKGAARTLKNSHAGAIRGATTASDYVGTKVAKVIGKTVAVGSTAAQYVFPD